jgi:asparaginyl-tRNA synthetase
MEDVTIEHIGKHQDKVVTLRGWLANKRGSGKIQFLILRDGTGQIQCVAGKQDVSEDAFALAQSLSMESSFEVTGTVKEDKRSPLGFELHATDIKLITRAEEYPIQKKEHGDAFLMDHRHLWLRSRRQQVILRIRHTIIKAIRDYFDAHDFVLVDSPIFTSNACEGTTTLFATEYFDRQAYLSQSGQLYQEAAALAFRKSYCFGPVFRAEKSKTRRHLNEFWMVEPEVAFMDLDGDMDLAEDFLCAVVQTVLDKHEKDLVEVLERDLTFLKNVKKPFPRISYSDAVGMIEKLRDEATDPEAKAALAITWGDDFGSPHETELTKKFDKPIMVHRYPAQVKAFYMKADPENPRVAKCVDVLAPEGYGEIIGGGQREDDLETLRAKIAEHQLPEAAFKWFLDLRRYGSVPHAGFGLGVERTVAWICGLHHVRETIPFARTLDRLEP